MRARNLRILSIVAAKSTLTPSGTSTPNSRAFLTVAATRAAAPPITGLDGVEYLTNESVFSLTELPRRLGVIGAGPIGCEMAQAFAQLGSEVSLVVSDRGILPREDREAAEIVRNAMERDGVKLLNFGRDIEIKNDPELRLCGESNGQNSDVLIDKLLVAVGRAPNVENLNLEALGVSYDKKGVKVNDRMQTTNPRIYAAGDICSPYQFTHTADFMARIVIQNSLFKGRGRASRLIVPWATYTSPELAHVGVNPQQASLQGMEIDTYTVQLADVDRAILEGETEGFVRVHVKKGTDKIVGATVVATNAGDLISELTLAMKNRIGLKGIGSTIHPYPTQGEAIRKLGDQFNRTRLTPKVASAMRNWLSWTR
jgi:pyruvate/2-oxoglutarate dehydrogenase complex dihydrolipoamide dehydrogenase (E3) component